MAVLLCAVAVALEVAGDLLLMKKLLLAGLGVYFVGTISWAWALQRASLSHAIVWFTAGNAILCVLAGAAILDERVSARMWIGVALVIAGLVLVEA